MKIQWTSKASSDLVRLHEHLGPVAHEAAARVVQQIAHAPDRLIDYPRIGEKLEAYEPREEVGRAACRERVCQYGETQGVAVSLKKKQKKYNKRARHIKSMYRQ